jgi:hypothetical protein
LSSATAEIASVSYPDDVEKKRGGEITIVWSDDAGEIDDS